MQIAAKSTRHFQRREHSTNCWFLLSTSASNSQAIQVSCSINSRKLTGLSQGRISPCKSLPDIVGDYFLILDRSKSRSRSTRSILQQRLSISSAGPASNKHVSYQAPVSRFPSLHCRDARYCTAFSSADPGFRTVHHRRLYEMGWMDRR